MKRQFKAEIQEDGLDLLLDTLTNAFGAILLIGLLLAILVQESAADKQHEESENNESQTELLSEELTNLHLRLQQLASEAKFLTEQLDALPELVTEKELDELTATEEQLVATITLQRDAVDNLIAAQKHLSDRSSLLENKQKLQAKEKRLKQLVANAMEDANRLIRSNEEEIARLEQQLGLLETRARANAKNEVQSFSFPELRNSGGKLQYVTVLKGNSLYRYSEANVRTSTNGYLKYRFGVSKVLINGSSMVSGNREKAISKHYRAIRPEREYNMIFVWSDSAKYWKDIRKYLVANDIDYDLQPMGPADRIAFGNGGGSGLVQ